MGIVHVFVGFPEKGGKIDVAWSQRITEWAALLRPQLKPVYIISVVQRGGSTGFSNSQN